MSYLPKIWLLPVLLLSFAVRAQSAPYCTSAPVGTDFRTTKVYQGSVSRGGGAVVLQGMDQTSGGYSGGSYFVYDGDPNIASDRGAIALYPVEKNLPASLSIAPSGLRSDIQGDDTASLALQLENGFNAESRFVAVMKKWGEMRFATIHTGSNSTVIPMTFYVGDMRLLELTAEGQVNLFFKGFPVMSMSLPYGTVSWQAAQTPVLFNSIQDVQNSGVLDVAFRGTEVNFVDRDGILKKAIKQVNGSCSTAAAPCWRRVNDLTGLW